MDKASAGIFTFAALGIMLAASATAQNYPERPVRMIIPFAAGGATDVPTRLISVKLAERLGQQFVVDNRPGQGGALGTAVAARAEPDGYTILQVATPFVVSPHVYSKLSPSSAPRRTCWWCIRRCRQNRSRN